MAAAWAFVARFGVARLRVVFRPTLPTPRPSMCFALGHLRLDAGLAKQQLVEGAPHPTSVQNALERNEIVCFVGFVCFPALANLIIIYLLKSLTRFQHTYKQLKNRFKIIYNKLFPPCPLFLTKQTF